MALIIKNRSNVAPLGSQPRIEREAMEQEQQRYDSALGYSQAPDPRADIQASIGAIPPVPPDVGSVPRGIDAMSSDYVPSSVEEAAAMQGSQFMPAAVQEPVVGPDGIMRVDPNAEGDPRLMNDITVQNYQNALNTQRSGFNDTQQALVNIAANPEQPQAAVAELLQQHADKSILANARAQGKISEHMKSLTKYVGGVGSHLTRAVKRAEDALFTSRTQGAVKMMDADGTEWSMPAGRMVLKESGIDSIEAAKMVSTMGGIALNRAMAQMGALRKPKNKESGGNDDVAPAGTDLLHDAIGSVSHHFMNGLRNAGIKVDKNSVDIMSKALVYDAYHKGDLTPGINPANGRWALEPSFETRKQAMYLERVGDAMTGTSTRNASSTSPNASGASFASGGSQLSAKSLRTDGLVTRAADITKNILGSVAYVFRGKDLLRKEKEIELITSPDFAVTETQADGTEVFKWSTHPLAKRNGLHEGAYKAARLQASVPETFNKDNPTHINALKNMRDEHAKQVMDEKLRTIRFTLASLKNKTGLRYAEFIHSLANQRFFVDSYDLDYMGSKDVIRDVMAMAYQDTVRVDQLFNPRYISDLKMKAGTILNQSGTKAHEGLVSLTPNELGAIGAMHSATLVYYTSVDTTSYPNILKMAVPDVIQLYNPGIATKLADLGEKYNAFMADPKVEPDNEMMAFFAGTGKGEALGSLALIDDMFRIKSTFENPGTKMTSIPLTHHTFYDGNQNGIFLQGLFFGHTESITRLSQANPGLDDMRVHALNTMVDNLEKVLHDSPDEHKQAWKAFWAEAIKRHPDGEDGVAKDFFRAPLMQNSYGKDASMFTNELFNAMEGNELYTPMVQEYLLDTGIYDNSGEAAGVLSQAVEATLRQIVPSAGSYAMKMIGRAFALLNSPMFIQGITGDTYVVCPVGMSLVNKSNKGKTITKIKVGDKEVYIKLPEWATDTLINPETGESAELPSQAMQYLPNFSQGLKKYFNSVSQKFDEYNNPMGISLARQAVVLLIQALDGDLVKWSTIEVNKGLKIPRPVTWVHDSIISTPGQSLIYNNMYNNIAIPSAVKEIAKLGPRIKEALETTRKKTIESVMARNEPVGIGDMGEFASIGAIFDEFAEKIDPHTPAYKNRRIASWKTQFAKDAKRKGPKATNPKSIFDNLVAQESNVTAEGFADAKWKEFVAKNRAILDEAEKLGWLPKGAIADKDRAFLAVPAQNFGKLLGLAEEMNGSAGPSSTLNSFFTNFAKNVQESAKTLMNVNKPGRIHQMSASGGGKPKKYEGSALPKARLADVPVEEQVAPKEIPPIQGAPTDNFFFDTFNTPMPAGLGGYGIGMSEATGKKVLNPSTDSVWGAPSTAEYTPREMTPEERKRAEEEDEARRGIVRKKKQ